MVWSSSDGGVTWSEGVKGLRDEKVNFLTFDTTVSGAELQAAAATTRRAQGSSAGLYALKASVTSPTPTPTPSPVPTPLPTPADTSCSLTVGRSCKGIVRAGALCDLTATIKSSRPTTKTKVSLESASTAAGTFKRYAPKVKVVQKRIFSLRIKSKRYIRAVFDDPACQTTAPDKGAILELIVG